MTDLQIVPQPAPFKPFVCPDCKNEILSETTHGWKRQVSVSSPICSIGPETRWKAALVACPTCSDHAIAKQLAEQIERLMGKSMLPFYAQNWNFATIPNDVDKVAVAACANFANYGKEKRGLYLHGDPGVGKTGLAISILQLVMSRGVDAAFIRSIDLMNRLREAIAKGTHEGDDLLRLFKKSRWAGVDDLAVERPTPYVIEQLYGLFEERRACGLYTIITSNFSLRELEEYWRPKDVKPGGFHPGKRVTDRLAEYCEVVHVRGRNLRRTPPPDDTGKIKPIRGN